MNISKEQKKLLKDRINSHRIVDTKRFGHAEDLITYEQVLELLVAQDCKCFWSARPLTLNGSLTDVSIDRLDNSRPHTIDNVVLCQRFFNCGRGDTSMRQFALYLDNMGILNPELSWLAVK